MTPIKIVCIDDYADGLECRKALLELSGYEVFVTTNIADGVARCRTEPIDLLILDYAMPGMTGVEVAEIIRRIKPRLPILMLSGTVLPILAVGIDRFISKGGPWSEVLTQVRSLIGEEVHDEASGRKQPHRAAGSEQPAKER